jgi:hypothetical protein
MSVTYKAQYTSIIHFARVKALALWHLFQNLEIHGLN